jgi:hypothetical protein
MSPIFSIVQVITDISDFFSALGMDKFIRGHQVMMYT